MNEIDLIRNKKDNIIINYIDKKYKKMLMLICRNAIRSYNGIPVEVQDIYNNFLFNVVKLVKNFDKSRNLKFKTYLGIKCKFFSLNFCRTFWVGKHKIMNQYSLLQFDVASSANDVEINEPINIDSLTELEKSIFKKYFVENLKISEISRISKLSYYRVKTLIDSICVKLIIKIKN